MTHVTHQDTCNCDSPVRLLPPDSRSRRHRSCGTGCRSWQDSDTSPPRTQRHLATNTRTKCGVKQSVLVTYVCSEIMLATL